MKKFGDFIREEQYGFSGFAIPRDGMPQIDDWVAFRDFLFYQDIHADNDDFGHQDLADIIPIQKNYDEDKVNAIGEKLFNDPEFYEQLDPVIISFDSGYSSDGFEPDKRYVADGHHRHKALVDTGSMGRVLKVPLPINKLIHKMIEYNESKTD